MAQFSDAELYRMYKSAKNQKEMLQILADLSCVSVECIRDSLNQYEVILKQKSELEGMARARIRELILEDVSPMNIAYELRKEKLYTKEFPLLVDSVIRQIETERRLEMARRERKSFSNEFKDTVRNGIRRGVSVLELSEELGIPQEDFYSFRSLYQRLKAAIKADGEHLEFNPFPKKRKNAKLSASSKTAEETDKAVKDNIKPEGGKVSEVTASGNEKGVDHYQEVSEEVMAPAEVPDVVTDQPEVPKTHITVVTDVDRDIEVDRLLESLIWHKAIWLSQIDYFQSEMTTLQKMISRCDERISELRRRSND